MPSQTKAKVEGDDYVYFLVGEFDRLVFQSLIRKRPIFYRILREFMTLESLVLCFSCAPSNNLQKRLYVAYLSTKQSSASFKAIINAYLDTTQYDQRKKDIFQFEILKALTAEFMNQKFRSLEILSI